MPSTPDLEAQAWTNGRRYFIVEAPMPTVKVPVGQHMPPVEAS